MKLTRTVTVTRVRRVVQLAGEGLVKPVCCPQCGCEFSPPGVVQAADTARDKRRITKAIKKAVL